jgi:hypothetical protein
LTTSPLDELTVAPRCKLRAALAGLDTEHADALRTALAGDHQTYPTRHIARIITSWGHPVGRETVRSHRDGECSCD